MRFGIAVLDRLHPRFIFLSRTRRPLQKRETSQERTPKAAGVFRHEFIGVFL